VVATPPPPRAGSAPAPERPTSAQKRKRGRNL
jgi:hypothetical protein